MPATAVVSAYVAAVAPSVATSVAAAVPVARKTLCPAAPGTAVQVTVTFAVDVPSVAETPVGAATFRQPVSAALAGPSPVAPRAFTVYE